MQLDQLTDGRWVIRGIAPDVPESDPYDRKDDAARDLRGLARFDRYAADPDDPACRAFVSACFTRSPEHGRES